MAKHAGTRQTNHLFDVTKIKFFVIKGATVTEDYIMLFSSSVFIMLVVFFGSGDVVGAGSFLEKNGYDKEPNGDFRGSFDPSLQKKNTN